MDYTDCMWECQFVNLSVFLVLPLRPGNPTKSEEHHVYCRDCYDN